MSRFSIFRLLSLVLLLGIIYALAPLPCWAFEEGFYTHNNQSLQKPAIEAHLRNLNLTPRCIPNDRELSELCDTAFRRADRILRVSYPKSIDIGLRIREDGARVPALFTPREIKKFLCTSPKKDLLAVVIGQQVIEMGKGRDLLAELMPFLSRLGYERLLVIGSARNGCHVLLDQSEVKNGNSSRLRCDQQVQMDPDLTLDFDFDYKVNFGTTDTEFENPSRGYGLCQRAHYERDDVKEFLMSEKKKDWLEVHLPKGVTKGEIPAYVRAFIDELGYKEVVIVDGVSRFKVEPVVLR